MKDVLKLFGADGTYPIGDADDTCINHVIDGQDTLCFYLPTGHDLYPKIREECEIEYHGNSWLVKKIHDDKIECSLNFDFLKGRVYQNYRSETRSLTEVLVDHLPEGWTIQNGNVVDIRRTIEFPLCTDFDVVMECMHTYGVYFVWEILRKTVTVYHPASMPDTGEYLTAELNLKNVVFKGSSTEFATRLYAYGNAGLSVADAIVTDENGTETRYGLPYVECLEYANKVVCAFWSDERYTDAESLKADAEELLAALAYPVRSYECDVADLAKQNPEYSFLDIRMHKKLTLIDTERGMRVKHQVVNYKEYPDDHNRNVVTLSCVPGDIMTTVQSVSSSITAEIDKSKDWANNRVMQVTAILTAGLGGHVYCTENEIYIMDTTDPATAMNVWRWNINGLGHSSTGIDGPYSMAMTYDNRFIADIIEATIIRGSRIEAGSIHADAISQTYTDEILEQSYRAAEGLVEFMVKQVNDYLSNEDGTGQLDLIQESITKIQQTVDGLLLGFTDLYRGGINYLENSCGLNGVTDDWEYTGTVETAQNDDTKNSTVSNSCFILHEGSTLTQSIDRVVVGSSYAVSVKVKKTSNLLATIKVVYNGDAEAVVMESSDSFAWTEYTAVIENVQSPTLSVEMFSRGDQLFVSDLMLCEGSSPRGWTPAPNEIYTSGVHIDKRGIEVSRSGSTEKTAITNREFAGYYNGEKVFTVNKDKTRMKDAVVDGTLTISDCKILPYEKDDESGVNIVLID